MRLALAVGLLLLSGCVAPAAQGPDNAATWSPGLHCPAPCKITLVEADFGLREPVVAVDPTDPRRLMALSMGMEVTGVVGRLRLTSHASEDGGATWTSSLLAPPVVGDGPATEVYDPAISALPDGRFILGGIALAGAYAGALVAGGMAQGQARAFVVRDGEPIVVDAGQGVEGGFLVVGGGAALRAPDKPALMSAPDGTLLLAYAVREAETPLDAPRTRVALAVSTDAAATWRALDAWAQEVNAVAGQPVAFDAARWAVPYATFERMEDVSDGRFGCGVALTEDAGATWRTVDAGACAFVPAVAVADGALYAAIPSASLSLARLDDETFQEITILDASEHDGGNIPALVALDDGALLATTFHPLADGKTSYRAILVRDGIVSAPLVLDDTLTRTPRQMGDYFGLAAAPGGAIATWVSDREDGGVQIVAARIVAD